MSEQNWQLKEGDQFAPATADTLEHLPSHHCAHPDTIVDEACAGCVIDPPDIKARLIEFAGNSKDLRKLCYDACAHISSLEHALAEASKDAVLMDYIGSEDFHLVCNINAFWIEWPDGSRQCATYDSPRDAIAAAMKEQA